MDRVARVKEIIRQTPIITLATVSLGGEPRSTPVTAAFDEELNCYWTSFSDTRHSENIRENPSVFISLFDLTSNPIQDASGVYIKARASELTDPDEISKAVRYVYERKNKELRDIEEFTGQNRKRLYKAIREQCWVSLKEDFDIDPTDSRKEIII
jgi:general stress protein 26